MKLFRVTEKLGWPLLIIMCLFPALLWFFGSPITERFNTPVHVLYSIGQLAGIVGLTLYSFNLLLSTRIKVFEDLFGGINKVYIAHHLIGGISLILLLIHPLALAMRKIPTGIHYAAMMFVPQWSNLPVAYGIIALYGMIILLILTFYVTLPYRIWLLTHKFLGALFFLASLHVLLTPNALTDHHVLRNYLLGFCILGVTAFIYRTIMPNIFVRRYDYTVSAIIPKAPGVIQIDLAPAKRGLNFKAGQFIFLSFRQDGISSEWHPFTISSAPSDGSLSVTVKSLGSYTKVLASLSAGMTGMKVKIEGAYGRFSYRNFSSGNQVWIAGGIGVTPFLSMAKALGDENYDIDLYYSVKTESELIDAESLRAAQKNVPGQRFRLIPFVADQQSGFLSGKFINDTSAGLAGKDFLLCGPPPMMKALRKQLRDLGVPNSKIHSEEFSMS
jgi:predicted ferric reductase